MKLVHNCLLVILWLSTASCTEIKSPKDAMHYLKQFGYLPRGTDVTSYRHPAGGPEFAENTTFSDSITMFQMYAGLNQSGQFDNDTMTMMNLPRCGMAERMEITENKNISFGKLSHPIPRRRKWRAPTIYFRIVNFATSFGMDPYMSREEIRRAFRLWEKVANIRCIEIERGSRKKADIDILFVTRDHGDGNAFGHVSVANVVAHAFFPDHHHFEGDVHFDNERLWTAFNRSGINLFQVAAHEIGHALGLDHSKFPESVMHMIVKSKLNEDFQLHDDDIQGIQRLYGPRRKRGIHLRGRGNWKTRTKLVSSNKTRLTSSVTDAADNRFLQLQNILNLQTPKKDSINVNIFVSVPPAKRSSPMVELEPNLQNFWKCFSSTRDVREINNQQAAKCYKKNVSRLLYSLNVI